MEQAIVNEVIKRSFFSTLPKWLRIVLIILSIVTVVYWLGFVIYKLLVAIRYIGAFIFEKRNYWTFLCCLLILGVGILLAAQFIFNLDPIGQVTNWIIERYNEFKSMIADFIVN